ncbi:MAG: phytanoyl-CoA dioxygenase family protein [Candidatus Latescibacteria bacterium]|nr:phytanoyl-CoA dioxygenase family protein [Candidatus Latescibacterota bacterium]
MTEAEIYEFDLNGYIVYRDILSGDDVGHMNQAIDASPAGEEPSKFGFSFLDLDPCFLELMAHPRTLRIMRAIIGDWLRLDHAYGLQMTRETMTKGTEARPNLHGGPRADHGEHEYQWVHGRMHNGLIVVMYALEDVNPGDGGFICVPGSHKANIDYCPPVDSHLVVNPSLRAGDMLIFTEALVHGTRPWMSDRRRRSLLYKYSPGHSTWADAESLAPYRALATTDLQRDLLRPPCVGGRTPLQFPEE